MTPIKIMVCGHSAFYSPLIAAIAGGLFIAHLPLGLAEQRRSAALYPCVLRIS
jgi:hypothetical protein